MTAAGRVAVEPGATAVRVASAGPDGEVRVAVVQAGPSPLPVLLAGLLDDADDVRLVHPVGLHPARIAGWAAGLPGRVTAVPTPVAAAWSTSGGSRAVLDVGHTAARAYLVRPDGAVERQRTAGGGAKLDDVVAELLRARCPAWTGQPGLMDEARRVREALSLLPEVVARVAGCDLEVRIGSVELQLALREPLEEIVHALQDVLGPGPPVLLVGGVARAPQLAELLDAAGIGALTVDPQPDAAAVRGALALPAARAAPPAPRVPSVAARPVDGVHGAGPHARWGEGRARVPSVAARPVDGTCGAGPHARWALPEPAPRRRWRMVAAGVGAAVLLGALSVLGAWIAPQAPARAAAAGLLVQYGYQVQVPPGWAHTGGLPERRRSLLTPIATPDGSDLIAVERTPLGYDAGAEPERAAAELRAEFDAAVAGGSALSGYDPAASVAGRSVTAYRQDLDGPTVVEWFVVLEGDSQLSIGCRHTPAGTAAVLAACDVVVASAGRA